MWNQFAQCCKTMFIFGFHIYLFLYFAVIQFFPTVEVIDLAKHPKTKFCIAN